MTHREVAELRLHEGTIKTLDVLDGRLVTAGADRVVRLTDPNGAVEAVFDGHDDLVNSVRASPAGWVATGSRDHRVRVWHPPSDEQRVLAAHDHWVMGVAWDPSGQRVASVSEDRTLRVWDVRDGTELAHTDLPYPSSGVDWSGDRIAVANGNRVLYLVAADTGTVVAEAPPARQMLWGVRFAPNGDRVAWTSRDGSGHVADRDLAHLRVLADMHDAQVWSVAWHPSGNRLVTASADGTAVVWSADGLANERIRAPAWVRQAAWLDGTLVLALEDGSVRLYEDDGASAPMPTATTTAEPPRSCPHFEPVVTATDVDRCQECGSRDELRLCLTCGHVGCCESQLAHATKHWETTGHPATTPTPPGEFAWRWCYACDAYVKRTG